MHPILRSFVSLPAKCLSLPQWTRFANRTLHLPFYHTVSDHRLPHVAPLYLYKNVQQFTQDLDTLLQHLQPVSLTEIHQHVLEDKPFDKPSFFLSFDDGLREVTEVIAPLLKQKGIPGCVFVNPDFVDNQALFYRYKAALLVDKIQHHKGELPAFPFDKRQRAAQDWTRWILSAQYKQTLQLDTLALLLEVDFAGFLASQKPYLQLNELHELKAQGWEIGAHSLDHPEYRFIPLDEQVRQTKQSIEWLKNQGLNNRPAFAFPFTDFGVSYSFFREMAMTPSDALLYFGTAGMKDEVQPVHLQRLAMEGTALSAELLLKNELAAYMLKKSFGREVVLRDN